MLTAEWWTPTKPFPLRQPLCGHTAHSDTRTASEDSACRECSECGTEALSSLRRFRWTDFNPNAQLQWDLARQTRSLSFLPRVPVSAVGCEAAIASVCADAAPHSRLSRSWPLLQASALSQHCGYYKQASAPQNVHQMSLPMSPPATQPSRTR